jgi:hypothetical protein
MTHAIFVMLVAEAPGMKSVQWRTFAVVLPVVDDEIAVGSTVEGNQMPTSRSVVVEVEVVVEELVVLLDVLELVDEDVEPSVDVEEVVDELVLELELEVVAVLVLVVLLVVVTVTPGTQRPSRQKPSQQSRVAVQIPFNGTQGHVETFAQRSSGTQTPSVQTPEQHCVPTLQVPPSSVQPRHVPSSSHVKHWPPVPSQRQRP